MQQYMLVPRTSPVVMKRLAPGKHQLKVTPVGDGCHNNKRILKVDINNEY